MRPSAPSSSRAARMAMLGAAGPDGPDALSARAAGRRRPRPVRGHRPACTDRLARPAGQVRRADRVAQRTRPRCCAHGARPAATRQAFNAQLLVRGAPAAQGFDDIIVLAPSARWWPRRVPMLAPGGVMNIFAGLPRGTMARHRPARRGRAGRALHRHQRLGHQRPAPHAGRHRERPPGPQPLGGGRLGPRDAKEGPGGRHQRASSPARW